MLRVRLGLMVFLAATLLAAPATVAQDQRFALRFGFVLVEPTGDEFDAQGGRRLFLDLHGRHQRTRRPVGEGGFRVGTLDGDLPREERHRVRSASVRRHDGEPQMGVERRSQVRRYPGRIRARNEPGLQPRDPARDGRLPLGQAQVVELDASAGGLRKVFGKHREPDR